MTLDETIKHAKEKANEQNYYASFERGKHIQSCKKCAEEKEQNEDWLEELKMYRDLNIVHCKDCIHWGTGVPGETENVKCFECGKYMVGANGFCVYGEKKECAE